MIMCRHWLHVSLLNVLKSHYKVHYKLYQLIHCHRLEISVSLHCFCIGHFSNDSCISGRSLACKQYCLVSVTQLVS